MSTEAVKSTPITNLDATPPVMNTAGKGGPARLHQVDGYAAVADAVTSGSTYRLCRVPSNAVVKHVRVCMDAAVTTFTNDIGVYYSDDASKPAADGTVIDADFFGSAVALAAIVAPTDYINESGNNDAAQRQQPLWQAVGLSSDPGVQLDIVLTNTATNSGAGVVYMEVEFAE